MTMGLPILHISCRVFWQNIASSRSVSHPTAHIWLPATSAFPKVKIAIEREEISDYGRGKENATRQLIAIPKDNFADF
jgi:hypothetical protein